MHVPTPILNSQQYLPLSSLLASLRSEGASPMELCRDWSPIPLCLGCHRSCLQSVPLLPWSSLRSTELCSPQQKLSSPPATSYPMPAGHVALPFWVPSPDFGGAAGKQEWTQVAMKPTLTVFSRLAFPFLYLLLFRRPVLDREGAPLGG